MPSNALARTDRALSRPRRDRRLSTAIHDAQVPAKLATARVQAAALVAHTGLVNVEILTGLELEAKKRQGPIIDERVRAIVDCYAGLVTTTLARLSLEE